MASSKVLRAEPKGFEALEDWPYPVHYFGVPVPREWNESDQESIRMAYYDVRTPDFDAREAGSLTFLCMHGVPVWSYLYRKMIPLLLQSNEFHRRGVRVVLPDFIGWGQSDKPVSVDFHNVPFHRDSIVQLIEKLDLRNITLICQDWGGVIGLTLPSIPSLTARFTRVIAFNTKNPSKHSATVTPGFMKWRKFVERNGRKIEAGRIVNGAVGLDPSASDGKTPFRLTQSEIAAYNLPFPTEDHGAALIAWPLMVATSPTDRWMDLWQSSHDFWRSLPAGQIDSVVGQGMLDMVFTLGNAKYMHSLLKSKHDIVYLPYSMHFVQENGGCSLLTTALQCFDLLPTPVVSYRYRVSLTSHDFGRWQSRCPVEIRFDHGRANTVNRAVVDGLTLAFQRADNDPFCTGVVFTSQPNGNPKKPVFCAGIDFKGVVGQGASRESVAEFMKRDYHLSRLMLTLKKPIVTAIHGICMAKGSFLLVTSDYRIASKKATFAINEVRLGIDITDSVIEMISFFSGAANAKLICLSGKTFTAEETYKLGMFDELVDTEDFNSLRMAALNRLEQDFLQGDPKATAIIRRNANKRLIQINAENIRKEVWNPIADNLCSPTTTANLRGFLNRPKKSKL